MNNEGVPLNIVLLPDETVRGIAIKLSEDIKNSLPAKIVLNEINPIPHLTIYQAEFPTKNVEGVINEVDEVMKSIKPFNITMSDYSATPQGNIWWNVIEKEEMANIQKEIIKRCNKLREGLLLPGLKEAKSLGPEYKYEVEKFGSLWVEKRCSPHISISAIDPNLNEKTLEFIGEAKKMSFIASKFAVGTLGIYGTVTSIIKEFEI